MNDQPHQPTDPRPADSPSPGTPARPEPRTAASAAVDVPPAELPKGFWRSVDYLLQNRERVVESLRRETNLSRLSGTLLLMSVVMSVIYGAVMGATNLLQGADMEMKYKCSMILLSAVKIPVLFLGTLLIVLFPVYVLNAFVGARLEFRRMVSLLLSSVAVTSIFLASMASVAFFFALTSRDYHFIKLLHVLFFIYAGIAGLAFLARTVRSISSHERRATPQWLFIVWFLLYMFVGTQLAWIMRPYVGSPTEPFQIVRERSGNFYESVYYSMTKAGTDQRQ